MFCDRCDRGFHTYCVGVKEVPSGSWLCITCKSNEMNTNYKSTPVKMKINSILSNGGSISPAKRGRPIGSLNKPKIPMHQKDNANKSLIKDGVPRSSSVFLRDLFDSTNTLDSSDSSMNQNKKRFASYG